MPNPLANTFTRFDAVGVREDLDDIISDISPMDTPLLTNARKGKAKQTTFEWQTDILASASTSNQQIEGFDLGSTFAATVPTVRLSNYVEIAEKDAIVSGTLEATDRAGRDSEMGYQIARRGKELKRDMESSMLANKAANAGSTSVARKTASLLVFIKTNVNKAANGTKPVYTTLPNDVWTDGTQRAFTETIVKDVLQQCYTSGANTSTIMVGALGKQAFSGFSGVVELNAQQSKNGQATVIGAADTYIGDFGSLNVIPNRWQRTSTAFFLDWDYISVDYLRPFFSENLGKTGDATKKFIAAEYGLKVRNEKALGVAVDLTP
jgi:hypothetical protein